MLSLTSAPVMSQPSSLCHTLASQVDARRFLSLCFLSNILVVGHDSIVNTALIHPDRPYLLTAGIERYIRLHSPASASPSTEPLDLTPQEVRTVAASDPHSRTLLLRAMGIIDDTVDEDDEDDGNAIALFDQYARRPFSLSLCGMYA